MWLVNDTPVFIVRTVGWSDKEFFSDFRNRHNAADQVYFSESNSKKSADLVARSACAAKFSLSKMHRDLKNGYFVKICLYLTLTSNNNP